MTYNDVSKALGIPRMFSNPSTVTKAGLYKYLRDCVPLMHPEIKSEPLWKREYLIHQTINRWASQLHVRIPFKLTYEARLRARADILTVGRIEPLRKQAFQWARRES